MSKSQLLSQEEFDSYVFSPRTLHYIEEFRRRNGLQKKELNILDWGCGRGRDVIWLKDHGYNAFGVEVDSTPIRNGLALLQEKGYDPRSLQLLDDEVKTSFPEGYFHIIFSGQVLEHVAVLGAVASEMARISRIGGIGFHTYPGRRHVLEAHLKMPCVHWLPKNRLREFLIAIYLMFGVDPRWPRLAGLSLSDRAAEYAGYSCSKTFYRTLRETEGCFGARGFSVSFETVNDPRVARHLGFLMRNGVMKALVNRVLSTFTKVELLLVRQRAA